MLYGPVGVGKSYSLCALARYLITRGRSCVRIGFEQLCLEIRDTFGNISGRSELQIVEPLINADILIIEDVGSGRSIGQVETDFSNRVFLYLLDTRLEACKPIFLSTNKTVNNLASGFDERIASRLNLLRWMAVGGRDKRMGEKKYEAPRENDTGDAKINTGRKVEIK